MSDESQTAAYAAMTKDVRWILIFAFPFAIIAVREFVKLKGLRRRRAWTAFGVLLSAIFLVALYEWFAPSREDIAATLPRFYADMSVTVGELKRMAMS